MQTAFKLTVHCLSLNKDTKPEFDYLTNFLRKLQFQTVLHCSHYIVLLNQSINVINTKLLTVIDGSDGENLLQPKLLLNIFHWSEISALSEMPSLTNIVRLKLSKKKKIFAGRWRFQYGLHNLLNKLLNIYHNCHRIKHILGQTRITYQLLLTSGFQRIKKKFMEDLILSFGVIFLHICGMIIAKPVFNICIIVELWHTRNIAHCK